MLGEAKVLQGSVINQSNTESKLPDQNLNPGNAPKTVVSYRRHLLKNRGKRNERRKSSFLLAES